MMHYTWQIRLNRKCLRITVVSAAADFWGTCTNEEQLCQTSLNTDYFLIDLFSGNRNLIIKRNTKEKRNIEKKTYFIYIILL